MRRIIRSAVPLAAAISMVGTAVLAGSPVKVIDTAGYEFGSASGADGEWIAWSKGAGYRGDHDLSVKQTGQPADVVEAGKYQQAGNIEGDILVFHIEPASADSEIRFYDLTTGNVSGPPAGINTSKDDEFPSISADHLLFSRGPVQGAISKRVFLYDFTTTDLMLLASAPAGGSVTADSISDGFASYTVCPATGRCNVFRYQISTGGRTKMPNPDRATYWSSVVDDGTVYYVQGSPTACGVNTKIMRFQGGSATNLNTFPDGIEIADLDAVLESAQPVVYFTRIRCSGLPGIWKIAG
jgi:hypothetical protein